ncbi:hypothetical protein M404DRAFT_35875 [Pisolithus tinctorius Marx 270]|uniref:Uncharacterized protein n=1 Tax=Pisolithus tinctorius Marx 270 TaxID=870435 RepID=A0A0C3MXP3_PISTI|nr:hypothetical protein M404DRAFT_35875 [Pisolithus tinctorius Marx 270]
MWGIHGYQLTRSRSSSAAVVCEFWPFPMGPPAPFSPSYVLIIRSSLAGVGWDGMGWDRLTTVPVNPKLRFGLAAHQ